MSWLFPSSEEKIEKLDRRLVDLGKEKKELLAKMEEMQRLIFKEPKYAEYLDRITQLEIDIFRLEENLKTKPRNAADVSLSIKEKTAEIEQLTQEVLRKDQIYIQMRFEHQLEKINKEIAKAEQKMEHSEQKSQPQPALQFR